MGWFDKGKDGLVGAAVDGMREAQQKIAVENAQRDARRAERETANAKAAHAQSKDHYHEMGMAAIGLAARIRELEEQLAKVADQREQLLAMVDAQHFALVRATSDVAQLIDLPAHVVAARYKLATIAQLRDSAKSGALSEPSWLATQFGGPDRLTQLSDAAAGIAAVYRRESAEGMSYSASVDVHFADGGASLNVAGPWMYWFDYNGANLDVNDVERLRHYQTLDTVLVRVINAHSAALPIGTPLAAESSQMASKPAEAGLERMHSQGQKRLGKWEGKSRWKGTSAGSYREWAVTAAREVSGRLGFDVTAADATRRPVSVMAAR
ncbi:hypothetical protein ACTSKR_11860 [Chitinibacteraceae bacterium HSL-7]